MLMTAAYSAMCIMLPGIYSSYVVLLGYVSNGKWRWLFFQYWWLISAVLVLPRPAAKRAAALAFINCLSNLCQIYTPWLYAGKCDIVFKF